MKKHLFIHLSFMGLMGLSTIAYGGSVWTKYGPEFKSGDPIPNGDCLEMMCQYGCVEDENGLNGTCCPNDGTNGSACTIGACCQSGSCINGKCGCEKDTDCEGEAYCDETSKTCIKSECAHLFQRHEKHAQGMGDDYGCCLEGDTLTTAANTPTKTRGYILGGGTTQYGCCPTERAMDGKCCAQNNVPYKKDEKTAVQCCNLLNGANLLVEKGDGYQACCGKNTPYFFAQANRCVQCTEDEHCKTRSEDYICRFNNYTCGCPSDKIVYTKRDGTKGCCFSDGNGGCCPDNRVYSQRGKTACCPAGSSWDASERACVIEAELSTETMLQYRKYNLLKLKFVNATEDASYEENCQLLALCFSPRKCATATETVVLTLTAPDAIDFENTSWQIIGSDQKAKIKAHIKQASCKEFNGEFSLTNNTVSSDGFSDFNALNKDNERCPSQANGTNGAGQHLTMEQEVSGNVATVYLRVNGLYGDKCTDYVKGRGVEGEVNSNIIRLKLI